MTTLSYDTGSGTFTVPGGSGREHFGGNGANGRVTLEYTAAGVATGTKFF